MKLNWPIVVAILALFAAPQIEAREYLKSDQAQPRGYSPAVVTDGGKIVWVSGHAALRD
jgi:2-iminobutanoate/2-iminopropanoate deaminase